MKTFIVLFSLILTVSQFAFGFPPTGQITQLPGCDMILDRSTSTQEFTYGPYCSTFVLDRGSAHVDSPSDLNTYSFAFIAAMASSGQRADALGMFNSAEQGIWSQYSAQCKKLGGTPESTSPRYSSNQLEGSWYYIATDWTSRLFCCLYPVPASTLLY